jgi:hypothetical protein
MTFALLLGSLFLPPVLPSGLDTCFSGAQASSIRPDGLLEVNGDAFFPVGLLDLGAWRYPDWHARIRRSRVNCVWDFEAAYADTFPRCRAVIDSAAAAGYHLLIGSGDTLLWDDPATPELEVDVPMYEPEELEDLLQCASRAPHVILGFTNRDEPVWTLSRGWLGDIDAAHILDTYDQIHAAVPNTFLAMNFAPVHLSEDFGTWRHDLVPFLDATDVVMHAAYPYPAGPGTCTRWNVLGYPACPLDRLADAADLFLGEINKPGQPLWMIIQAFKGIPRQEARWEAYASIIHGATGIFWAGWTWVHRLGNGEENWPVIEKVISEIAELHGFLIGEDLPPASTSHPDVEVRAKRHATRNEIVAFAVSRREFSGEARIRLPHLPRGEVEVLHEGRTVEAKNGWIVDRFDRHDAHGYRYVPRGGDWSAAIDPGPLRFAVRTYPNPTTGEVLAELLLPREASIRLTTYDTRGRRVAQLEAGRFAAGVSRVPWRAAQSSGKPLPSGIYFLRAETSRGDTALAKILIQQ